jgi:hypothetical protein
MVTGQQDAQRPKKSYFSSAFEYLRKMTVFLEKTVSSLCYPFIIFGVRVKNCL